VAEPDYDADVLRSAHAFMRTHNLGPQGCVVHLEAMLTKLQALEAPCPSQDRGGGVGGGGGGGASVGSTTADTVAQAAEGVSETNQLNGNHTLARVRVRAKAKVRVSVHQKTSTRGRYGENTIKRLSWSIS